MINENSNNTDQVVKLINTIAALDWQLIKLEQLYVELENEVNKLFPKQKLILDLRKSINEWEDIFQTTLYTLSNVDSSESYMQYVSKLKRIRYI